MQLITITFEQLSGIYPKLSDKVKVCAGLIYSSQINDFNPAGLSQLYTIPVIEHQGLSTKTINTMSACDIAGSTLLFSLGTKVGNQLKLIKDGLGSEVTKHFPKYQSGRRMVERATKKGLDL